MTKWSIRTCAPLPIEGLLPCSTGHTLADAGAFVTRYFSEDTEDQTPSWRCRVYAISYAHHPEAEIVYEWEHLRPLSSRSSNSIYSVAENGVDDAKRRIVEKAIEGWTHDTLAEGAEVIVPIDTGNWYAVGMRVRSTVALLPINSGPLAR